MPALIDLPTAVVICKHMIVLLVAIIVMVMNVCGCTVYMLYSYVYTKESSDMN